VEKLRYPWSDVPSRPWQRRRTHFMRNLLMRVPKSAQSFVATARTIFAQPDAAAVHEQHGRIVAQLEERFPDAPRCSRRQRRTCSPLPASRGALAAALEQHSLERLNKEIRRRTDVVGSSPTAARSSAWSAPSSPSRTTSGPSPAAT